MKIPSGWALAAATATAAVAWDPRAPAADPKRLVGLAVALTALAMALVRPTPRLHRGPALAWAAFVVWSAGTLTWGVPAGARDLAAWLAAAALALTAPAGDEARQTAERAAGLAGAAAAAIAIAQRLGGARGLHVHGGQGNANWLGLLLVLTLPLSVGALGRARSRGAQALLGASIALQGAGLALSHSRVAWVAAAVAMGAMGASLVATRVARGWWRPAVVAIAAVCVALLALAARAPTAEPPVSEGGDVPVALAWEGRMWIGRASLDAAARALPAGAGLGGFAHAYLDAQGRRLAPLSPKVASRRFLNATTAHDDWLEVLVDSGAPGLLLLALALAWALRAAACSGWVPGAAALGGLALSMAGDSPLRQPGVVLLVGLVVGACTEEGSPRVSPRVTRLALAACAVAASLLLALAAGTWIANRALTNAREALPGERPALLRRAARLAPRSGEVALEQGLHALEAGDAETAAAHLRRSRALLANVGTDVALGNAEVQLGRPEAALRAYEAALARHPGSFRAHANATAPLLALGRVEAAEQHLAIAASLWPGHAALAEIGERVRRAKIDRATGE